MRRVQLVSGAKEPGMGVLLAVLDTGSTHKTVRWLTDLFCRSGRKTARKLVQAAVQPRAAKRRTCRAAA